MNKFNAQKLLLAVVVLQFAIGAHAASIITAPEGLSPGDAYRLIFVTSGTITGSSPNISTYDNFVNAAVDAVPALADLDLTWEALVSSNDGTVGSTRLGTFTDDIYNLAGTEIAAGSAGLFSGTLLAPVSVTELGTTSTNYVWAGAYANGGSNFPLGASRPDYGLASASNVDWLQDNRTGNSSTFSLYAVSSEIIVAAEAPEPDTLWLLTAALLAGIMMGRADRWRRTGSLPRPSNRSLCQTSER